MHAHPLQAPMLSDSSDYARVSGVCEGPLTDFVQLQPTFAFFKDGKELARVTGADVVGLRNQLDKLA